METNRVWLLIFGVIAIAAGYLWWSMGSSPSTKPTAEETGSMLSDPDAPALGEGRSEIHPSTPPPVRNEGSVPDPRSPNAPSAPSPGYESPPPNLETFGSPPPNPDGNPAFEAIPPQPFENPDFVTPAPPPAQFDTEPMPFNEEGGPPQGQPGQQGNPQFPAYEPPPQNPDEAQPADDGGF